MFPLLDEGDEVDPLVAAEEATHDGGLYFGLTGDYDSSSDIDILTNGVERSMAELLALIAPSPTDGTQAKPEQAAVEGEQPGV
jgi:hypothetical protein